MAHIQFATAGAGDNGLHPMSDNTNSELSSSRPHAGETRSMSTRSRRGACRHHLSRAASASEAETIALQPPRLDQLTSDQHERAVNALAELLAESADRPMQRRLHVDSPWVHSLQFF